MTNEEKINRLRDIQRCTPIHTREDIRDFEALEGGIAALEALSKIQLQQIEKKDYPFEGLGKYDLFKMDNLVVVPLYQVIDHLSQGEWIKIHKDNHESLWYRCSICDRLFDMGYPYHYCPHCGAKMKREGEEE